MGLDVERPINHRDIPRRMTPQDRANTVGSCSPSYDLRLLWMPTNGSISIDVLYLGVTQTISVGIDVTAEELKELIDLHPKFIEEEVECECESAGGFPSSNIIVTLPDGAKIAGHESTLEQRDDNPYPEFRVDICGCSR